MPQADSGSVWLTAAQLSMLLEGIDWRHSERTWQPRLAVLSSAPTVDGTSPVAGAGTTGEVTVMTLTELLTTNAALSAEVKRSHEALKIAQLTIDKIKVELAYLRRMKHGRSSERREHSQPELVGGRVAPPAEMVTDDGLKSNVTSLEKERKSR